MTLLLRQAGIIWRRLFQDHFAGLVKWFRCCGHFVATAAFHGQSSPAIQAASQPSTSRRLAAAIAGWRALRQHLALYLAASADSEIELLNFCLIAQRLYRRWSLGNIGLLPDL